MVNLTKEEIEILDFFAVAEEQIEKWIRRINEFDKFQKRNKMIAKIMSAIIDIFDKLDEEISDASNSVVFVSNWQNLMEDDIENNYDQQLQKIEISLKSAKEYSNYEIREKWVQLWKIINKIYVLCQVPLF